MTAIIKRITLSDLREAVEDTLHCLDVAHDAHLERAPEADLVFDEFRLAQTIESTMLAEYARIHGGTVQEAYRSAAEW